jgi:hypothetical protein
LFRKKRFEFKPLCTDESLCHLVIWQATARAQGPGPQPFFRSSPAKSELLVAKTQRVPALYNGVRHAAPVEPTHHERPVRMPRPVSFAPLTRSEEVFPCAGRRTKSLEPSPSITPGAVHHGSVGLQTQRFTIPSYNSRCTNKCSVSVFAACWVTNLLIRYNLCQPAVAAHTSTLLTLIRWSG